MHPQEYDVRSLALHRLAIKRIRQQPELLQMAHEIVTRWLHTVSPSSQAYLETWQYLIEQDVDVLEEVACQNDERSTALRQSSHIPCTLPVKREAGIFTGLEERSFRRLTAMSNIFFCGNPHGRFVHIIQAVNQHRSWLPMQGVLSRLARACATPWSHLTSGEI